MCHVSVFATRPNIINSPSCLSWLAPESCRILVLVWDLEYLTFVFVLQFAAGGWVGIPQSSMEDEVKLEPHDLGPSQTSSPVDGSVHVSEELADQ